MKKRRFVLLSESERGLLVIRPGEYIFSHHNGSEPGVVEIGRIESLSQDEIILVPPQGTMQRKMALKRRWRNIWSLSSFEERVDANVRIFEEKKILDFLHGRRQ